MLNYKKYINEVPDFPKKGISFKDISPLLANGRIFKDVVNEMGKLVAPHWSDIPKYWIGIEARGFLFASALAHSFGGGMIMCRKAGKLPPTVFSHSYKTEYSEDTLQIKQESITDIRTRSTSIIVDDVLATGETMLATDYLCKTAGYDVVDHLVLIDLKYIPLTEQSTHLGKFNLDVKSLIQYE
jgi:adenine phosphoribosyltransferase